MAIKTDRLSTGFTFFFTLSQLYGVMEVLGLLYQWPWERWSCCEMAVTLGERCPWCMGMVNMVGRVSCKAFEVCNQLTHMHVKHVLYTHTSH